MKDIMVSGSDEHKYFQRITLQGKPLKDCELVWSDKHNNTRMYIVRDDPKRGFWAHVVGFVRCDGGVDDCWDHESLVVSTILEVSALWDGVRHLEFNRNEGGSMNGYLYYQSMPDLLGIIEKVRELEVECCREPSE